MIKHIFSSKLNPSLIKPTALLSALLFSTATLAVEESVRANNLTQYNPEIETLHGIQLTTNQATILVTSKGCTKKEDFIAVLNKSMPPQVTFIRLTPDHCRGASRLYSINFSLNEIGARTFSVVNTIEGGPSTSH